MIDLKNLEERFEKLFREETPESFNKWLREKRANEFINDIYMHFHSTIKKSVDVKLSEIIFQIPQNENVLNTQIGQKTQGDKFVDSGNTQYAMAA